MYEQLSVFENLELALKADRRVRASLFSRLTGAQLDRIGEVLALIHLTDEAQRTAGLLSHGQKQWLEIGMLLMQDPKLLLLDEPVAGMTDEETERTAELFLSLEGKHSLVVVEHDMKFVEQLTQGRKKVTVLHEGSVLAEGLLADVQANRRSSRSISVADDVERRATQPVLRRLAHPAQPRLRSPPRRSHGRAGPQRRRQDHAAEEPDGRGAGEDAARSRSTAATSRAPRPTSACAAASATCRRAARSSAA